MNNPAMIKLAELEANSPYKNNLLTIPDWTLYIMLIPFIIIAVYGASCFFKELRQVKKINRLNNKNKNNK